MRLIPAVENADASSTGLAARAAARVRICQRSRNSNAGIRALLRQDRGAVAVEFAFVVPVMLVLLFCGYEVSRVAGAFMRLNDSAQMMADLVSRQKSVSTSQIDDFCTGTATVMSPFSTDGYSATVASVTRTSSGVVVNWQDASCGNGRPIGSAAALASPYIPMINDSVIMVQASYTYRLIAVDAFPSGVLIVKRGYARTRGGTPVAHQ